MKTTYFLAVAVKTTCCLAASVCLSLLVSSCGQQAVDVSTEDSNTNNIANSSTLSTQAAIAPYYNLRNKTSVSLHGLTADVVSPNGYIRHFKGLGSVIEFSETMTEQEKQSASWKPVPGLADPKCYSFQSVNFPGDYLRHAGFRIKKSTFKNTALFKADSTWCLIDYPDAYGFFMQSKNYPNAYLRRYKGQLWLACKGGTQPWDLGSESEFKFQTVWSEEPALAQPK